jgi:hypothetical protein
VAASSRRSVPDAARAPLDSGARGMVRLRGTTMKRAAGLALVLAACSVGHGSGDIEGTLRIEGCRREGRYLLAPNAFFAQAVEKLLKIRVQRGGNIEVQSDGLAVLVEDSSALKRDYLGADIDLASGAAPHVEVTAYFNDTCPPGRDNTPVVLNAVAGTIRFDSIYAPKLAPHQVRITAELTSVRFEDSANPAGRWAELSGNFDFLYVRGSPAQYFP